VSVVHREKANHRNDEEREVMVSDSLAPTIGRRRCKVAATVSEVCVDAIVPCASGSDARSSMLGAFEHARTR
jgi:hypothetical protein